MPRTAPSTAAPGPRPAGACCGRAPVPNDLADAGTRQVRVRSALEQLAADGLVTLQDGYRVCAVCTTTPTEHAHRLMRTAIHRSHECATAGDGVAFDRRARSGRFRPRTSAGGYQRVPAAERRPGAFELVEPRGLIRGRPGPHIGLPGASRSRIQCAPPFPKDRNAAPERTGGPSLRPASGSGDGGVPSGGMPTDPPEGEGGQEGRQSGEECRFPVLEGPVAVGRLLGGLDVDVALGQTGGQLGK